MTTEFKHLGMVRQGMEVVYADPSGRISWQLITHVWANGDIPPLLNLKSGETSVPHFSQVEGASGFYWR